MKRRAFHCREFGQSYSIGAGVGEGSFAKVVECWSVDSSPQDSIQIDNTGTDGKETGSSKLPRALKAAMIDKASIREVKLLRELSHPNIVTLCDAFVEPSTARLLLVYEHGRSDLHTWLRSRGRLDETVALKVIRSLTSALCYLHSNYVMHRDIKPSNILLVPKSSEREARAAATADEQNRTMDGIIENYVVKLADFGLSRIYRAPPAYLDDVDREVVTHWYRAPELLLGARHYTPAIDIWSLGCVLGELLTGKTLFRGDVDNNDASSRARAQWAAVFSVTGFPDNTNWPVAETLPEYSRAKTVRSGCPQTFDLARHMERLLGARQVRLTPNTLDLLNGMLRLNPTQRLSASDILSHPALASI